MIRVTRLNGRPMVINAELIKTVEATPDTMLTLLNGDHVVVLEDMETVVRRAVEYARLIRTFALPISA
ncbi:MAG: flagellar FlbD family protein [Phycisphaerales bacterium]|nr:flagellar FlbD family protein [Phycisphaerales bacterium]